MRTIRHILAIAATLAGLAFPGAAWADREMLSIPPRQQQTPVWCWAAAIEMVFSHYDVPNLNPAGNMQCAIVATLHPACSANCGMCVVSGGSTGNMVSAINQYRAWVVGPYRMSWPGVDYGLDDDLDFDEIVDMIDSDNPIIAGISPSGMGRFYPPTMSEHVAVIIGYDDEDETLIVNDPYPFPYGFDPYLRVGGRQLRPGRYEVPYDAFVYGLGYKDSIVFDY